MQCFVFHVSFIADYLNNLSPDSKEYEDTQGTAAEPSCVTQSQLVLGPADTHTHTVDVSRPSSLADSPTFSCV